jgi:tetratricopeptide (TPR) repeat protein
MKTTLPALAALALACAMGRSTETVPSGPKESASPPPAGSMAPASLASAGTASPPRAAVALDGLGSHRRTVTNASPEAQRWFDQGLNVVYAFNHDEAIRAFTQAAALSPGCAMAWWGIAYANGPHINNPQLDAEHAAAAWSALQRAQAVASDAGPVEQALIGALAKRYGDPPPADRAALDAAYAEAMRNVQATFPQDPDVAALAAEAQMDVHPWDYWDPAGNPRPWTAEIVRIIEAGLAVGPRHPMLNHLYIHAVEASAHPERATRAADVLLELQPGLGHMVHMPSHIYVRTGRWADAIDSNQRAVAADDAYRKKVPRQGFYSIYMAHNHHMLAYAAMMAGRSALALQAANALVAGIPPEFRAAMSTVVDLYYAMPLEVLMRFGRWEEILAAPDFGDDLPGSRALRHVARAVAFAAQGDVVRARDEQQRFEEARAKVSKDAKYGNNPVSAVLQVAHHLVAGELLYRQGKIEKGLAELRFATAAEDALRYDEPPDWIHPSRHALGAALAQAGRHAEAERVFREDLRRVPGNGWALYGLTSVLARQRKNAEARRFQTQFQRVWKDADVQITSACFCQQGV